MVRKTIRQCSAYGEARRKVDARKRLPLFGGAGFEYWDLTNNATNDENISGQIMKKMLFGVGINDADYPVTTNKDGKSVSCPFFSKWSWMLYRCYDPVTLNNNPRYRGCFVCDEWLTFSNFKKWMEAQEWEGMELDKDIIIEGNKTYCPEACAFVHLRTNRFFVPNF